MKTLTRIYQWFENSVMVLLLAALLLLCFGQVGGRLLANSGFESGDEIIYHLVLWTGLWGAILATRQKEHITIDIVSRFVSGRKRHLIQAITNAFSAGICSILLYASIHFIRDEMIYNDRRIIGLPLWIWQIIIPYAFTTMSLRFLIHTAQDLRLAGRSESEISS
ncbi:TRAP transporter small permease [bacterium]|nr:TRAP transporter small permease [candidate division CSSED10-310 bacterium]